MSTRLPFALAAILLVSCTKAEMAPDAGVCPVTVEVFLPPSAETELVVRGTIATSAEDVTVRSVLVGGVRANPDSFNFGTFSAVLDRDRLAALPATDVGSGADGGMNRSIDIPVAVTLGVGGRQVTCDGPSRPLVLTSTN